MCIRDRVSIDDREHVPNHGKQVVALGTVIVTPPLVIIGIRGYGKDVNGKHARFDVFTKDAPKNIEKLIKIKPEDDDIENAEKILGKIKELYAIVTITPRLVGLEQKAPYIFEVGIKGGDIQKQFLFVKDLLGKEVKIDQVFENGTYVDTCLLYTSPSPRDRG